MYQHARLQAQSSLGCTSRYWCVPAQGSEHGLGVIFSRKAEPGGCLTKTSQTKHSSRCLFYRSSLPLWLYLLNGKHQQALFQLLLPTSPGRIGASHCTVTAWRLSDLPLSGKLPPENVSTGNRIHPVTVNMLTLRLTFPIKGKK